MEDFGKRLKEERERLGLTQAQFAQKCGVGRTAQFNYERGEREPSFSYMDAAEKLGVDIHYVFGGTRRDKDWEYARAFSSLLYTTEMLLGLEEGRLEGLCKQRVDLMREIQWSPENPFGVGDVSFAPWVDAVMGWLATSTKPGRCFDAALFSRILDAIDQAAQKAGTPMSNEKRVRAALMLYPETKSSGGIDTQAVEEAVSLAAK